MGKVTPERFAPERRWARAPGEIPKQTETVAGQNEEQLPWSPGFSEPGRPSLFFPARNREGTR